MPAEEVIDKTLINFYQGKMSFYRPSFSKIKETSQRMRQICCLCFKKVYISLKSY